MTVAEQRNAPAVAATTCEGKDHSLRKEKGTGSFMDITTAPNTWPISNRVTVTEGDHGPAVVVTADTPLNLEQTRRLVRDLLEAQRFIADTFEPIPFVLA